MNDRHAIIAFLATLGAIVALAVIAATVIYNAKAGSPDAGMAGVLGGAITGLIGVIGTFRPKTATSNVEKAETVNQGDVQ